MRVAPAGVALVCGVFLAAGAGCTTFHGSETGDVIVRRAPPRTVAARSERVAGPLSVRAASVVVGAEPALLLTLEAPTRLLLERRAEASPVRREAAATLVVANAVNENLLAYTLGLVVLAPLWLPLQYKIRAESAATLALESGRTGEWVERVGSNDCPVLVREAPVPDEDAGEEATGAVTTLEEESAGGASEGTRPLAHRRIEARAGDVRVVVATDARGRLAIPLRALLAAGGDALGRVALRLAEDGASPGPVTSNATTAPVDLYAIATPSRLAAAVEAVLASLGADPDASRGGPLGRGPETPEIEAEERAAARAIVEAGLLRDRGRDAEALALLAKQRPVAGSPLAAAHALLFTVLAAELPVEIVRGPAGRGKVDVARLEAVRKRAAEAPLEPLESHLGGRATLERSLFGDAALPVLDTVEPGVPGAIRFDAEGRPFFVRVRPGDLR